MLSGKKYAVKMEKGIDKRARKLSSDGKLFFANFFLPKSTITSGVYF